MNTDIHTWPQFNVAEALRERPKFNGNYKTAYALISKDAEVLYIGCARSYSDRIEALSKDPNRRDLWRRVSKVAVSEDVWHRVRRAMVEKYAPLFNFANQPKITLPALIEGRYLYKYYNGDECVYVGITSDFRRRSYSHKAMSWYSDDLKLRLKLFTREENAKAEEIRLIEKYRPSGNKIHNPDWKAA